MGNQEAMETLEHLELQSRMDQVEYLVVVEPTEYQVGIAIAATDQTKTEKED